MCIVCIVSCRVVSCRVVSCRAGVMRVCVQCVFPCVWRGLASGNPPLVLRFSTPPCVPAKRPHVYNMRALCRYTRSTHGGVLNLSTGRRVSLLSVFLALCLSCSPFFLSFFSLLSSLLTTKQCKEPITRRPTSRRSNVICRTADAQH